MGPWTEQQADENNQARLTRQEDRNPDQAKGNNASVAMELARHSKEVDIRLKLAKEAALIREAERFAGIYVRRDEFEAEVAKKCEAVKKGLQQLCKALRQVLADESDPAMIEELLTNAHRAVVNVFGGHNA